VTQVGLLLSGPNSNWEFTSFTWPIYEFELGNSDFRAFWNAAEHPTQTSFSTCSPTDCVQSTRQVVQSQTRNCAVQTSQTSAWNYAENLPKIASLRSPSVYSVDLRCFE